MDTLEIEDKMVTKEVTQLTELMVILEEKDLKDWKAFKDQMVNQGAQVRLEVLEHKEFQEKMDYLVNQELTDNLDSQEFLETKEILG